MRTFSRGHGRTVLSSTSKKQSLKRNEENSPFFLHLVQDNDDILGGMINAHTIPFRVDERENIPLNTI
ncbi:hypothetical protein RJ40_07680 [Methanofollis aquaemaris]|uniref:Uncharacterized protein n=1 Tax=Methanofollis aquaemaris TaxID=126734 RepID=A0A8A3S6U3_9EURY|nr:hypothetical protein [Methanofollis aquaemaris]QSZ67390.1 hypothetical protein RJ40_07680 [Methanofollis aquaemaris]